MSETLHLSTVVIRKNSVKPKQNLTIVLIPLNENRQSHPAAIKDAGAHSLPSFACFICLVFNVCVYPVPKYSPLFPFPQLPGSKHY